ncbi:hypothetical protein [Haloarchaeobius sp. DFWS5]|uniref:hypothetical protein n=1 Tax=Haloarchaeobius sp. DFWS5 TaxID=3446114 RepID=UPI003EBE3414
MRTRIADIIAEGIERGVFRDVDPTAEASYILSTTDGPTGCYLALGMDDVGDHVRERLHAYIDDRLVAEQS